MNIGDTVYFDWFLELKAGVISKKGIYTYTVKFMDGDTPTDLDFYFDDVSDDKEYMRSQIRDAILEELSFLTERLTEVEHA